MERSKNVFCKGREKSGVFNSVKSQIDSGGTCPQLIIFFSDIENFSYYAAELKKAYPSAVTIGSTTYTVFSSAGYAHEGLSVMAVYSGISCTCGILQEIARHPLKYAENVRTAFNALGKPENTCCLEFTTAFSKGEELVLDTFKSVLENTGVSVFGGSAGSNLPGILTFVSLNGEVFEDASVFVFIHNENGRIAVYRENIFRPTASYVTATDVYPEERIVYEYDGEPAAKVIAEKLGVSDSKLQEVISLHPMGRLSGADVYISDCDTINPDGSISYFSRIYNFAKLALLEVDDIDRVWSETKSVLSSQIPFPSFTLAVNSASRTKYFESINRFDDFVRVLSSNFGSFAGVSGYGEQLDFVHLNQTLILACFE